MVRTGVSTWTGNSNYWSCPSRTFSVLDRDRQWPDQDAARLSPGHAAGRRRYPGRAQGARRTGRRRKPRAAHREWRMARRARRAVELVRVLQRPRRQRLGPPGEAWMKYMLMMFGDQAGMMEQRTPEWIREMIQWMTRFADELSSAGELVSAEGLV